MPALKSISLFLLSVLCCTAQVAPPQQAILRQVAYQQAQVIAPTFSPTNIAGYPALVWYRSDFVTTNGGGNSYTWVNLMGNPLYDLTNNNAKSTWPTRIVSDLNGHDALNFDAAANQFLNNQNLTATQPTEFCMVVKFDSSVSPADSINCYTDGNSGGRNTVYYNSSSSEIGYYAGVNLVQKSAGKGYYFVLDAAFNGIASVLLTNNVIVVTNTTTPGANNLNGLYVARDFSGGGRAPIRMVEFFGFSTNLTDTIRQSLYAYLKTWYGLP
jgi:hypothetical protein